MVRVCCPLFIVLLPRICGFLFAFVKFRTVFVALLASTIPVSILGVRFSMSVFPFWTPEQFSQCRCLFPWRLLMGSGLPQLLLISLHVCGGT